MVDWGRKWGGGSRRGVTCLTEAYNQSCDTKLFIHGIGIEHPVPDILAGMVLICARPDIGRWETSFGVSEAIIHLKPSKQAGHGPVVDTGSIGRAIDKGVIGPVFETGKRSPAGRDMYGYSVEGISLSELGTEVKIGLPVMGTCDELPRNSRHGLDTGVSVLGR